MEVKENAKLLTVNIVIFTFSKLSFNESLVLQPFIAS